MKRCPICGAHAVESAGTCFQCLYHFDTLSTEDVSKLGLPVPQRAVMQRKAGAESSGASASVAVLERPEPAPRPLMRWDVLLDEGTAAPTTASPASLSPAGSAPAETPAATPSPILIPAPSPARCFAAELRFGTAPPHTIKTHKGSLYVGRAIFNDLVIDDECIMRRHAHIYRLEQGVFMELLGTSSSATVNGKQANHISLICDGDVISLGPCDAIIHC
ncbi:MAG: FHA domain-containing protein [Coriobacteriia bacterium]|nr:FHA domain-containing protein [Coriobacteriia bacterium]